MPFGVPVQGNKYTVDCKHYRHCPYDRGPSTQFITSRIVRIVRMGKKVLECAPEGQPQKYQCFTSEGSTHLTRHGDPMSVIL